MKYNKYTKIQVLLSVQQNRHIYNLAKTQLHAKKVKKQTRVTTQTTTWACLQKIKVCVLAQWKWTKHHRSKVMKLIKRQNEFSVWPKIQRTTLVTLKRKRDQLRSNNIVYWILIRSFSAQKKSSNSEGSVLNPLFCSN